MPSALVTPEIVPASPRGIAGIAAVRAILAANPEAPDAPVAARRARLAAFAAAAPRPPEPIAEDRIGSVRVLRVTPEGARGRIVYLHGGAYVLGSADTHIGLAAACARAAGAGAVVVDYRLAPEHPYPAALDDAIAVWAALAKDDVPTALVGDSAGGGLALAVAVALRDRGLTPPVALAVTSPWCDLTLTAPSLTARADVELMLTRPGLALDAKRYRGPLPAADPHVSPVFAELHGLPPTLIQVGEAEILYDDAATLAARLNAAGVAVRLQSWQAMGHAWAAFGDAVPEAAASIADLGAFCRAQLDTGAPA